MTVHDDSLLPIKFSSTNYEAGILGVNVDQSIQNYTRLIVLAMQAREEHKVTNVYVPGKKTRF